MYKKLFFLVIILFLFGCNEYVVYNVDERIINYNSIGGEEMDYFVFSSSDSKGVFLGIDINFKDTPTLNYHLFYPEYSFGNGGDMVDTLGVRYFSIVKHSLFSIDLDSNTYGLFDNGSIYIANFGDIYNFGNDVYEASTIQALPNLSNYQSNLKEIKSIGSNYFLVESDQLYLFQNVNDLIFYQDSYPINEDVKLLKIADKEFIMTDSNYYYHFNVSDKGQLVETKKIKHKNISNIFTINNNIYIIKNNNCYYVNENNYTLSLLIVATNVDEQVFSADDLLVIFRDSDNPNLVKLYRPYESGHLFADGSTQTGDWIQDAEYMFRVSNVIYTLGTDHYLRGQIFFLTTDVAKDYVHPE